ncbi:putative Clathrin assembly protein [Zostera marina]|uniref:Putative Clathrin assembly protein n=1 Tax=Zostera marina TaxID=29655 RepID=A0A0K9Q4B3_ZOSMR|nr:putative Clathrin assembly protein [Zostera marina]
MLGANTQKNLRKYIGVIKDSTSVGLVKVNSDYKNLDIAVVKATSHFKVLPKEKHVRTIFDAIRIGQKQTDVLYCIQALARRLAKTHNWVVALKTLIVIHRALREVESTLSEELINYGRHTSKMLNLIHFRDESSQDAWEYSTWIRSYALFLEERLECFHVLNYDIELAPSNTRFLDITVLLEHLSALQQLLFRLLECKPQAVTMDNFMIQHALKMISGECLNIFNAIYNGTINLTEKFFELQLHTAVRSLDIYKKATDQMEKLSEFYELCIRIGTATGENFVKIEQPLMMLENMETHVKNAAASAMQNGPILIMDQQISSSREVEGEEFGSNDFWQSHPIQKSVSLDSLTSEDSPCSKESNILIS